MRTGQRWLAGSARIAAVSLTLWLAACGGSDSDKPEVRETAYGKVRGVDDSTASGTYFWKGLPFAQPHISDEVCPTKSIWRDFCGQEKHSFGGGGWLVSTAGCPARQGVIDVRMTVAKAELKRLSLRQEHELMHVLRL